MFQGLKKGALGANWVIGMQQYRQVCTPCSFVFLKTKQNTIWQIKCP